MLTAILSYSVNITDIFSCNQKSLCYSWPKVLIKFFWSNYFCKVSTFSRFLCLFRMIAPLLQYRIQPMHLTGDG